MKLRFAEYWRADPAQRWVKLAYLALFLLFGFAFSQFYIPGKGFTYLINFGDRQEAVRLSKVRGVDYYVARYSDGYDAQYYAQIAMDPSLHNQALKRAVDSLAYRARRILFAATAYVLGGGEPAQILRMYALQNAVSWLGLGVLLLHWFPPKNWDNFLRWVGIMFSFGVCVSVRYALVDGPSLLLIAFGVYLLERNRPWAATAVLALSGLGKETNLLGAAALAPVGQGCGRAWARALFRGALVAAPLVLWVAYIAYQVGPITALGDRNFGLPFAAYMGKWKEIAGYWPSLSAENLWPLFSVLMMISLTAQFLYFLLRPQWTKAWWRIGASFAVLMVFLGEAVWEGYPGAASRVLLPMQLAFNVLVPKGRWWSVLLVAGNLTLLMAPSVLQPPPGEGYILGGTISLLTTPAGKSVLVELSPEWYGTERSGANYWSWTPGTAAVIVQNPHASPLLVRLRFILTAKSRRTVWLRVNGTEVWQAAVSDDDSVTASLSHLALAPGTNRIEFATDTPPVNAPADLRHFAFCLHNFRIDVQELQPPTTPPGTLR